MADNKAGQRLLDAPHFAPLYESRGRQSHSPLELILEKGRVQLNPLAEWFWRAPDRHYSPPGFFLDEEIQRIGTPLPVLTPTLMDSLGFAAALADALRQDVHAVEAARPGWTNLILCGGKDSLNLLLLPWRNPVVAASAWPNYPLVEAFARKHELEIDVVELDDEFELDLDREILINACRNNLAHCRWGGHLTALARRWDRQVVIWLGQIGGSQLTPQWRRYRYVSPPHGRRPWHWISKKPTDWPTLAQRIRNRFWRPSRIHREAQWYRAAHWQGAHMGILHELTGAPVLSSYHGPSVTEVLRRTDMARACQVDVRPQLGELLFGAPVYYPEENPSPPPSRSRDGVSDVPTFLRVLRRYHDIEVVAGRRAI